MLFKTCWLSKTVVGFDISRCTRIVFPSLLSVYDWLKKIAFLPFFCFFFTQNIASSYSHIIQELELRKKHEAWNHAKRDGEREEDTRAPCRSILRGERKVSCVKIMIFTVQKHVKTLSGWKSLSSTLKKIVTIEQGRWGRTNPVQKLNPSCL